MTIEHEDRQEIELFDSEELLECLLRDDQLSRDDQVTAEDVVDAWIDRGSQYVDIATYGIQPAMRRIGSLWETGRISVAQEYLVTTKCQELLMRAFEAATFAPPRGEKALFACVQHNHHSLGLRILSDTFIISGWDVKYLGANVPTEELVRHVETWRPDFVGLSLSLMEHVATANEVIGRIRTSLGERTPKIMVGGLTAAWQLDPTAAGVDAEVVTADAKAALDLV